MEKDSKYELAGPNPGALIQSLRAFGYDISTAIADLIDNSITAGARNISVLFEWNEGKPWIAVLDNGLGMTEAELVDAMRPGNKNPLDSRSEDDLGRFGLGLKTASFSQCRKLTVASKSHKGMYCTRCWDIDLVTETNEWRLLKSGSEVIDKLSKALFEQYVTGTIVLWEKIDRIVPDEHVDSEEYQEAFLDYARQVKEHIARTFSDYMRGRRKVDFTLNGLKIQLWDPFMLDSPLTTNLPKESIFSDKEEVQVRPFIIPHPNKLNPEQFDYAAGKNGWFDSQGFYVYRNNRLLIAGDWLIDGMEKKEQYKLARIRVDISSVSDMDWKIDVKKSTAVPPISIQKELKRIAIAAQKASSQIFRHRGKKITRSSKTDQDCIWHQSVRQKKLGYSINRSHPYIKQLLAGTHRKEIACLLELIEETIPVPMIISDYSEKSDEMLKPFENKENNDLQMLFESLYNMYVNEWNWEPSVAILKIGNTEPFIFCPEALALFCEKKGIKNV